MSEIIPPKVITSIKFQTLKIGSKSLKLSIFDPNGRLKENLMIMKKYRSGNCNLI